MMQTDKTSMQTAEKDIPQVTQDLDLLNDLATLLVVTANVELGRAQLTFELMEDK